MDRCAICNGRMVQASEGSRCMNSNCEGSKVTASQQQTATCKCGETMHYTGLNSWGEPKYACSACGAVIKL